MAVEWQIDHRPFSPPATPVPDLASSAAPAADELFRWAQFLAQGEELSVARQRAVDALLEAGDYNRDAIYAARLYALRALGRGAGTRDVVDLLQAALDASPLHAKSA
jgi:hypothetical protein